MALETLIRFDSTANNLHFLRHVRRDPKFPVQLYFISYHELDGGERSVSLFQVTTDGVRSFLTDQFIKGTGQGETWTLDEVNKQLTVLLNFTPEGIKMLKQWKICYKSPNRRLCIAGHPRYAVLDSRTTVPSSIARCKFPESALIGLAISPKTGQRIMGTTMKHFDCRKPLPTLAFYPVELHEHFEQNPNRVAVTFLSPLQSMQMETRSYVFSRLDELLVLYSYKSIVETTVQPLITENACMILYSYNAQVKPIQTLEIDPVKLVRSFLTKTLLDQFLSRRPDAIPERIFFAIRLSLLGHVRKYVLFSLEHNYVLAAKWPRNWYTLPQLPNILQKKTISMDRQMKYGEIADSCLIGTDLYVLSSQSDTQVIRRMALGHKLKDYRRCALCGQQELRKRKSKNGKRIAKFKVCRKCKELNFHHYYLDENLACHYCSEECQQKHWKQHKLVHCRAAKQRKFDV